MKDKKEPKTKTKFRCSKCKYECFPWKEGRTKPFSRCPYCGTEGTLIEKKHVLEELY